MFVIVHSKNVNSVKSGSIPPSVITIPERHGEMDGRTTCRSNTELCVASRVKYKLL